LNELKDLFPLNPRPHYEVIQSEVYQSLYKAKADYRRHGDEIAVIVKEEEIVFQGYLGNETIDCAPNGNSLSATGKIDAGCPGV